MSVDGDQQRSVAVPTSPMPRRRLPIAATTIAVLLLVSAAAALLPLRTTAASGDAPEAAFSAHRAHRHLEAIARTPRPTGSAASAAAREYLVTALAGLGVTPVVDTRTVCRLESDTHVCGSVANIWATLPGSDPTGTVLIVAHYDSVIAGPGAADDGYGIAAAVEAVRGLAAAGRPRNDIMLLFTDGEEAGLLGARAALTSGRMPDPSRTMVLNLEARGTSGPVVGAETGDNNARVVRGMSDDPPVLTSFADAVYRYLPHDTDFSEFRAGRYTGINLAVVGGSAHYHTTTDDLANVDLGSLQDMGEVLLAATRRLGDDDLADTGGQLTHFTVANAVVSYPPLVDSLVAVLAVGAILTMTVLGRRRASMRLISITVAGVGLVVALVVTALLGVAAWSLVTWIRPHHVGFVLGDPYRPLAAYLGLVALAIAATLGWWRLVAPCTRAVEIAAATGWIFLGLTATAAVALPRASYLFAWPCLVGAVAVAIADRLSPNSAVGRVLAFVPGASAVLLIAPVAALLFPVVGVASAAPAMLLVTVTAALVLAGVPTTAGWRRAAAAGTAVLVLTGLGVVVTAAWRSAPDTRRPELISLLYAHDADRGEAYWISPYPLPHPFIDRHFRTGVAPATASFPYLSPTEDYRWARAKPVAVPAPSARLVSNRAAEAGRQLRVRVVADQAKATLLGIYVDTGGAPITTARFGGAPLDEGWPERGEWDLAATYVGPTDTGVELDLTVAGSGPVRIRVLAQSPDLPAAAMAEPMPPHLAGARHPAMYTMAARTVTF